MGELIDLSKHPEARKHVLAKQALLKSLEGEIDELNHTILKQKQDVSVLKEELKALDKLRKAAGKPSARGRVSVVLSALGFRDVESSDAENKREAVSMIKDKTTRLRLEVQKLERMYEALGDRIKKRIKTRQEIERELSR